MHPSLDAGEENLLARLLSSRPLTGTLPFCSAIALRRLMVRATWWLSSFHLVAITFSPSVIFGH